MTTGRPAAVSETVTDWSARGERVLSDASDSDVDGFVRRHEGDLLRFFQGRVPQPSDADDLVQESYIRLLRYRSALPEPSLKLLLFRIARNLLNDFWRYNHRHRIEESTDPAELVMESTAPSQERLVEIGQDLRRLERFLMSLPLRCREVFVLSRVRGMSNQEVARHLGISEKMVEKHISRALTACRQQLGAVSGETGR